MKKVKFKNEVHYRDLFGTLYCNHRFINKGDPVLDSTKVTCEKCIKMDEMYTRMVDELNNEIDNEILNKLNI